MRLGGSTTFRRSAPVSTCIARQSAGRLVQMTIPPRKLRSYDYTEPQYKFWCLFRSCVSTNKSAAAAESHAVGVTFIGKNPSKSYLYDQTRLFEIQHRNDGQLWHVVNEQNQPGESRLPKGLRRHTQFPLPTNIILETMDDDGNAMATESTVTENISLCGASVF